MSSEEDRIDVPVDIGEGVGSFGVVAEELHTCASVDMASFAALTTLLLVCTEVMGSACGIAIGLVVGVVVVDVFGTESVLFSMAMDELSDKDDEAVGAGDEVLFFIAETFDEDELDDELVGDDRETTAAAISCAANSFFCFSL